MYQCKKCSQMYEGNFCPNCGTPRVEEKICPNCGAKAEMSSRFCSECGQALDTDTEESIVCQPLVEIKSEGVQESQDSEQKGNEKVSQEKSIQTETHTTGGETYKGYQSNRGTYMAAHPERNWSTVFLILQIVFLVMLGAFYLIPIFGIIQRDRLATDPEIFLILTAFSLLYCIAMTVISIFGKTNAKKASRKKVTIFSTIVMVFSIIFAIFNVVAAIGYTVKYQEEQEEQQKSLTYEKNGEGYTVTKCKKNNIERVKIPATYENKPVTAIGNHAFDGCSNLTSITIPNSVTSIGNFAFFGCSSLTNVKIPNSVTKIGNGTFSCCRSLTNIKIPNHVTSLENGTFYDCSSLTSITIPDSVTSIGDGTFWGCSNLTYITIPDGVTRIGEMVFYNCKNLTNVTIPDNVTKIGNSAFSDCSSLTSITIPDSVTSIGGHVFYGCSDLTSITFNGTKTQFQSLPYLVRSNLPNGTVHCTDGDIYLEKESNRFW